MKVKELIKPAIIKKINLILFPLLALIFVLAGTFIYQLRSEQSMRLGKLQARIASLNILEFVKSEMINYINACIGYNNMVEMYDEAEPARQQEYLTELTNYVLQTNNQILSLRCLLKQYNEAQPNSTSNQKIEVLSDNINKEVASDIDRQFHKLGLLEQDFLTKTDNVTITAPYPVRSTNARGQACDYTILSFYKAIVNKHENIIGQTCLDVQSTQIEKLLRQLQDLSTQNNCNVHLYLNEDDKFIGLSEEKQTIELSDQKEDISDELMAIINDGYEAEYDDISNSQYFFVMPARLPNFNSEITVIVTFSHAELNKSISDFVVRLLIIMVVAYLLIVAILLYVNKRLYKKFIVSDIVMLQNYDQETQVKGTL